MPLRNLNWNIMPGTVIIRVCVVARKPVIANGAVSAYSDASIYSMSMSLIAVDTPPNIFYVSTINQSSCLMRGRSLNCVIILKNREYYLHRLD